VFNAGWTISAISRHTGRDCKTVRRVIAGEKVGRERPESDDLEARGATIESRSPT